MAVGQPGIAGLLRRHGISVHRAAGESGLTAPTIYNMLSGDTTPSLLTVQKVLSFARRYEPGVTFEDLFADPGADQASDAPERAVASAAGGAHTPCETQILSGASRGDHE